MGRFLIPAFWGMAALVALEASKMPTNSLHAMPTFLATLLPTGLIGLVIASMLAAEMSTDASYLLTWSSILYNDIIAPLRKQPFSERQGLYVNRVIILAIGVFLLFYGLWYQLPGRVWDYLSITGNIYLSSISVLVVACCYWKRATRNRRHGRHRWRCVGPHSLSDRRVVSVCRYCRARLIRSGRRRNDLWIAANASREGKADVAG